MSANTSKKPGLRPIVIIGGVAGILVLGCIACVALGLLSGEPAGQAETTETAQSTETSPPTNTPEQANTSVSTDTPEPSPTLERVMINCPECGDLPLTLWEQVDDMGAGAGQVRHGEQCYLLAVTVTGEGTTKVKLACPRGTGWLREEAITREGQVPTSAPTQTQPAPTSPPEPTEPSVSTISPAVVCDCSGDIYNCSDFGTREAAQACYDYCWDITGRDVHRLDRNNNRLVCEDWPP